MQLVSTARRSPSQAPEGTRHANHLPTAEPHSSVLTAFHCLPTNKVDNCIQEMPWSAIHVYFCYLCPAGMLSSNHPIPSYHAILYKRLVPATTILVMPINVC